MYNCRQDVAQEKGTVVSAGVAITVTADER